MYISKLFIPITKDLPAEAKIKYHQLIMGLPHAKRLLINDFSETNSFPTAEAINIYRNSSDLRKLV